MPFGMQAAPTPDFADIIKYDANAGRMFKIDYNSDTREKVPVDITNPPPRFAADFGSLEVGYGRFSATGPEYHIVPEGQTLPPQPLDKDDKGRLLFRSVFRLKLYGKILDGLREWASTAGCVLEAVEDLYHKFRDAPEGQRGQIPIVELIRTIPVTIGRGARQRTLYTPCFTIVGWTDRVPAMGPRIVPPPEPATPVPTRVATNLDPLIEDDIPF
jgi:hypothetical protein